MGILNIKALKTYSDALKKETQQTIIKKIKGGCTSCQKKKKQQ